ncbi:MAG: alpha/beta fold hydrolase [Bacteroidetes bacterium]|jgi:fermentation-respiration switch protein FrsA (DUF1100 family)|nr:alpha/beta fold hydrolase [Bacteroidota bacterium]
MKKLVVLVALLIGLLATTEGQKAKVLTDKNKKMESVNFKSEGLNLAGNLYYPNNYEKGNNYPALIVVGSWTTVKEQMAAIYAAKFAKEGFITLAFDFRNYGESEGEPRYWENPTMKTQDIRNAVTYLQTLPEVNNNKIGTFAVCAGAMYALMAAAEDSRIRAVVTAASWLHDEEAVKLFYGGEEGVNNKIQAAREAKKNFANNGRIDYIETISTSNPNAAMYGPYDYYLNPERGAIDAWSSDKFAVMSWEDWLTLNPMPYAKKIQVPTLMIHSDGCVLPQYTRNFYEKISTDEKKLEWVETDLDSPMQQFNFYDQEYEVGLAVSKGTDWFKNNL